MNNPRMKPKERGLLKGAVRRVFSRSELRIEAIKAAVCEYSDAKRPRVKKWSICQICMLPSPTYLCQVDHILPIVPLELSLEDMTWDEVVDRTWCSKDNLQVVCKPCHKSKSLIENRQRRQIKKERNLK